MVIQNGNNPVSNYFQRRTNRAVIYILSEQQNDPANSLGVFILLNEAALHVKTDV